MPRWLLRLVYAKACVRQDLCMPRWLLRLSYAKVAQMVEILGLPQVDRTGEGRKEEETLIEPQIEKHFQNKQQWPTTEICKPSSTFTRSPCKSTQKRQRPNTNVKRVQNQLKCSSCKQWWEEKPNLLEGPLSEAIFDSTPSILKVRI